MNTIFFDVDTQNPIVGIDKNTSLVEFNSEEISINWSATDDNLDTVIFNVTYPNGTLAYSSSNAVDSTTLDKTDLVVTGLYTINIWANDSTNNVDSTSDTFTVSDTYFETIAVTTLFE